MISDEYAAGFFDGEGCVYAATRRNKAPTLLVCISNTNKDVLLAHKARWGGSLLRRRVVRPRYRDQWQWVLAPRAAEAFLRAIAPYVLVKREVVALALRYCGLMRLPASQRLDYTLKRYDRWRNPKPKEAVASDIRRPEFKAKVVALHSAIRAANARGDTATRHQPIDVTA